MATIGLLLISNIFMTVAWYGHLRFKEAPLWKVILLSWLIASLEYCFQVPANRLGHGRFSAAQLKIFQEAISLTVFFAFAWLYLGEKARSNELIAMGLIFAAVVIARPTSPEAPPAPAPAAAPH